MKHNQSEQILRQSRPTIVFYIHTKGIRHYRPDWRKELIACGSFTETTYGQVLYWRKYMEYFTIERPQLCLRYLLPTIPTNLSDPPRPPGAGVHCGVEYHVKHPHYSGNMWAATCDYISRKLSPVLGTYYLAAEFWIAGGSPAGSTNEPYVNLADYLGPHDLYRQVLLPEHYRFSTIDEENDYANVKFPIIIPDIKD
jgi:hypothetical protein